MRLFLAVTFGWSWGLFLAAWVSGAVRIPFQESDPNVVPLLVAIMCGPMLGAIAAAIAHGSFFQVLRLTGKPSMWWIRAWAFPLALVLLALAITIIIPGVTLVRPSDFLLTTLPPAQRALLPSSPLALDAIVIFQAAIVGSFVNSIILLNEELGWRGFMLSKLSHWAFWERHLCIGLVWGIWHIPVVAAGHNYPGEPVLGPAVFTAYCMLLAPLLGYFSERANSVFGASIFHGTLNATAPISILVLCGVDVFERGIVGWPGILLLALCCVWLAATRRDDVKAPSAGRSA